MVPAFSGDPDAVAAPPPEADVAAEAEVEAGTGAELGVGPVAAAAAAGARSAGHLTDLSISGTAAAAVDAPKAVTATLSGCTIHPALPQRDPAVPWADGRSETEASPFLFIMDGGTVELVSPVFEAAGQAFVAQVRFLLRGTLLNRTYGTDKNLHILLFLLEIFGPIYYGPR